MSRISALAFVVAAVGACHGSAKVKIETPKIKVSIKKPRVEVTAEIVPVSPNIGVSNNIADECTVQISDLGKAPKFDYDAFDLLPADREVLDRIATCVTSGPLTGRTIELIGRADPRGTQEYNLGLGTKRAGTVAEYLKRVGVPGTQISTTTRGDLDAGGKDEYTWRGDRRVDLQVMEDINTKTANNNGN
jgi:peptidoglycan-associated lipoprotein